MHVGSEPLLSSLPVGIHRRQEVSNPGPDASCWTQRGARPQIVSSGARFAVLSRQQGGKACPCPVGSGVLGRKKRVSHKLNCNIAGVPFQLRALIRRRNWGCGSVLSQASRCWPRSECDGDCFLRSTTARVSNKWQRAATSCVGRASCMGAWGEAAAPCLVRPR